MLFRRVAENSRRGCWLISQQPQVLIRLPPRRVRADDGCRTLRPTNDNMHARRRSPILAHVAVDIYASEERSLPWQTRSSSSQNMHCYSDANGRWGANAACVSSRLQLLSFKRALFKKLHRNYELHVCVRFINIFLALVSADEEVIACTLSAASRSYMRFWSAWFAVLAHCFSLSIWQPYQGS